MSTAAPETIRCPKCGTVQPLVHDFCHARVEGKWCREYLGWLRPGAKEPVTEGPPPPAPEPSVQLSLEFAGAYPVPGEPLTASVIPGDRVELKATVRNVGPIVDKLTVMVHGLLHGWAQPEAQSVHLVPIGHEGHSERAVTFVLRPPRDSTARAAAWPLTITVRSESRNRTLQTDTATLIIRPFSAVVATARPLIAKGRTKARFWCDVRNDSNTPIAPTLMASDSEGVCTITTPSGLTQVPPGSWAALPLDVRAPRVWFGTPVDRQLQVLVAVGAEPPGPPLAVTFRQKPLIPWWVPVVLLLLAGLAIALYAVLPHKVTMPSVRGASTVFVAERQLQQAGLKDKPTVKTRVLSTVKSGTVIDQNPHAFTRVDRDVPIVLRIAVPATYTIIPDLTGMTVGQAEEDLNRRYLKLGLVTPSGAPASRKIVSQVPLPGRARSRNITAVSVVLAGPGDVKVPNVVCLTLGQAEKKLTALGLKLATPTSPVTSTQQATGQVPAAKTTRPLGTAVTMLGFEEEPESCQPQPSGTSTTSTTATGSSTTPSVVTASRGAVASVTEPVAFDDGKRVRMASSGHPLGVGEQPAWSPDGKLLAVRERAGIRVSRPGAPATDAATVRDGAYAVSAPKFAPAGVGRLLAFLATRPGASSRLCLARVTTGRLEPSCLTLPHLLARSLAWSPGGTVILVVGARPGELDRPGVMRVALTGDAPQRATSWRVNRLLWRVRFDGRTGPVFDVAYDPAAPRLAVVTDVAGSGPRVALMPRASFPSMGQAEWVGGAACQVAWDPSGAGLAIVEAGRCPAEGATGRLVSLELSAPQRPKTLARDARNPAWQP